MVDQRLKKLGLTSTEDRANFVKATSKIKIDDIDHFLRVAKIVSRYDNSRTMILTALYHDILEKKGVSKKYINKITNSEVIFLIEAISNIKEIDINNLPKNQEDAFYQIKVQSTRKLLLSAGKDVRVILLKIAEQIDNLKNRDLPSWKKRQIAKSGLLILAPLADRLMLSELKSQLQELAFSNLEPKKYRKLNVEVEKYISSHQYSLDELSAKLENVLVKEKINFDLKSRIKNLYSIKEKMEQQNLELDDLHDLIGLRILVSNKENCYLVLSALNRNFSIDTIKDYIARPKPNGYQSIHVIAQDKQKKKFEIQIRTKEMEDLAENGPWAHWHYKEKGSISTPKLDQERKWFKDLAKKLRKSDSETLEELRINIFRDKIFVYSPKNEVIELPKGSTPIDYAYRIHSDLGNYLKRAKVDGKLVKLNQELKNGQKIEIDINKGQHKTPTRDWLKFAKTKKAKEHIRKIVQ